MTLRRVPERLHERMRLQRRLHDPALHAAAAPVNQPHFPQARVVRRAHVLLDDRSDVPRAEGVQVEEVLDRDAVHSRRVQLITPNS